MDSQRTDPLTLVIHELRTPLGLLATAASLLIEELGDTSVRAKAELIEQSALRMLRNSQAILEAAGILAADQNPEPYRPADIAASLVSDLQRLGCPINLSVAGEHAAPPVLGYARVFEALLQTLLNNGLDHQPAGTEIDVRLDASGPNIELRIENDISPTKRHRGLGLGALLAARLAEACGADLWTGVMGHRFVASVTLAQRREASAGHIQHRGPSPEVPHRLRAAGAYA